MHCDVDCTILKCVTVQAFCTWYRKDGRHLTLPTFLQTTTSAHSLIWGHPIKVVQRAFQNYVDCLEQKEFLQWNTRTKDHLCANFQDIWLSSKSWILDIKYTIPTIKMQILHQFFCKKINYIVVINVPSFHQPAGSSLFFLAFCLQLYGTTFYG